ncbi:MAG TPA: hydrogenase maturation nickel metallochaperone HypA [bacterium]|nr:hydrogenase maturation nickel metallochaperone HypA [bacterium]
MHELSIAVDLVELAAERAGEIGGRRVEAVHVRLGALAGVVEESLRFSFDLAAGGTPVDGARLVVERVPVTVFCAACGAERILEEPLRFRCPVCGAPAGDVVRGREIVLTALEVDDDAPDR